MSENLNIDIQQDRLFTKNMKYEQDILTALRKITEGETLDEFDLQVLKLAGSLVVMEFNRRKMHRILEEIEWTKFGKTE